MEQTHEKKLAAGLSYMGRALGELLELKASCRRRMEYLEANRERISEYVFNKLRQEYLVYLDAVDGEVALGLSEYEIKLAEIRLFANQLKLLEKSYREKLEELSLRHSLGEFDQAQYESLCAEHEAKMKRFAGSLEKYQGQKKQIETFLAQARIEQSLLDEDEPVVADAPQVQEQPGQLQSEPEEQPAEYAGPPNSSLLDIDSDFSEPEPETPVAPEPEPAPELQESREETPDAESEGLDSLPGLSAQPEPTAMEQEADEEPAAEPVAQAEPDMPSESEIIAPEEEPAAVETQESELPEQPAMQEELIEQPESEEASTEETLEAELPEEPAAREELTEKPEPEIESAEEALEAELPEEPAPAQSSAGHDLEALMGAGAEPQASETSAEPQADTEAPAGEQKAAGFDLEHIFGSSQPPAEQPAAAEEPAAELNWEETAQEPAAAEPAQDEPAGEQAEGTLEDSLLSDLSSGDSSGRVAAETTAASGGVDLDEIIDQSGAAGPAEIEQPAESPDAPEQPEQAVETPEQEEPEPDLDLELEQAETEPEPPQEHEQPVEEPEPAAETALEEPREEAAGQPEGRDATPSLVSLALQRAGASLGQEAVEDQDETEGEIQVDDVTLDLGGDAGEADVEVRLTMNQTIDAIKKKTVKCPECGTMNYAIRWYCENCEATLTAL